MASPRTSKQGHRRRPAVWRHPPQLLKAIPPRSQKPLPVSNQCSLLSCSCRACHERTLCCALWLNCTWPPFFDGCAPLGSARSSSRFCQGLCLSKWSNHVDHREGKRQELAAIEGSRLSGKPAHTTLCSLILRRNLWILYRIDCHLWARILRTRWPDSCKGSCKRIWPSRRRGQISKALSRERAPAWT